jgi:L-asparagine transporter-like permease
MNNFKRTLTFRDSVFLGLSSMIGAGLFVNVSPAAFISSYSLVSRVNKNKAKIVG